MKPISRTLELSTGLRYHALEWDADSDHTVLLVHGFLDLSWTWQPVVAAGLAGRWHLVAPDMRGHGDSDRVGAGGYYHFMDYLADLDDLITQVARKRLSLVGHSMGGSICAYYTGTFPDRVERLALLEGLGPPESSIAMPERVRSWLTTWKSARERPVRTYGDRREAAERLRKFDPRLDEQRALELAEHSTVATADGRYAFKHDPLHVTRGPYPFRLDNAAQFWQAISCPVLCVEGSESMMRHRTEDARRRLDYLSDVRSQVIADAGHMMQRHQPAEVAILLASFLAGQ
ncbi:MAG: alpha/beta hydrolase [Myxococcota bacterium]